MRAIILAAGRGKRLQEFNPDGRPKCLIEIGGKSLLQRQLHTLYQSGINHVDLVVGYAADMIIKHVSMLSVRPDISFQYNPRFELGSVLSLANAGEALSSGSRVLIMDADVLFHPRILTTLIRSPKENCLLLDREFEPGDEPVKIAIRNGQMVEFRKILPDGLAYDTIGESVGFFRFEPSVAAQALERCRTYESNGMADLPHEEVIRDLLLDDPGKFDFEDITGLAWIETDFPQDMRKAEQLTLPAIRREIPEF